MADLTVIFGQPGAADIVTPGLPVRRPGGLSDGHKNTAPSSARYFGLCKIFLFGFLCGFIFCGIILLEAEALIPFFLLRRCLELSADRLHIHDIDAADGC